MYTRRQNMAPACTRYRSFERSRLCRHMTGLVAAAVSAAGAAGAATIDDLVSQGLYCSATAQAVFQACNHQTQNDYLIGVAICINESDDRDRVRCFADARDTSTEDAALCRAQLKGRRDACGELGQGRYDPEFEPVDFDRDFTKLTNPN